MPIKTILLHMADDDRHSARLEVAIGLAKRFKAFLDIVFITTPASMPPEVTGRAASMAYISEVVQRARRKSEAIEQEVRSRCADLGFSYGTEEGDALEILAYRAAFADLAIVTQALPQHLEDRIPLHLQDRLPLLAPCPTLVIPWSATEAMPIGNRPLIAWRPTRESALAVRNALPFLKAAEKVTVLAMHGGTDNSEEEHEITYLARHGVKAERDSLIVERDDVGETILRATRETGSDMVVMGAYGHSRWRELVVGGTTRSVLRSMEVPVMMSH